MARARACVLAQRPRAAPAPRRSGCRPCRAGSAPSSAPGRSCDARAADAAHLALGLAQQVVALEADRAARRRGIDQPQHRQRGDRLARARLADERELLARRDRERDVVDDASMRRSARSGARPTATGRWRTRHDLRVSKASRSASPMKVSSSSVSTSTAKVGKMIHHASRLALPCLHAARRATAREAARPGPGSRARSAPGSRRSCETAGR